MSLLPPSSLQALNLFDEYGSKVCTLRKDDEPGLRSHELTTFVTHIHESISVKPHLYLSYTWVLYMAIFSGGRYIRAKLNSAGEDFWANTPLVESGENEYDHGCAEVQGPESWPLSFWNFPGSFDGEDLKADYKSRVGEIERALTLQEREEIITEAVEIMKRLLQIVRKIEVTVADGVAKVFVGGEPCQSHLAEINSIGSHKDKSYLYLSNSPAEGDRSFSALLCKHLLPMGMVDLLTGVKNAFFSAGQDSKVPVAVPVKSNRT